MKKIIVASIIASFLSIQSRAQESDLNKPFSQIKSEKEAYFEEQVVEFGDSILYGEGSEYSEYQRWLRFWEPRLSPNATYKDYATAVKKFYGRNYTIKNKTLGNSDPWKEIGPFNQPNHGIYYLGGGELGVGIIHDMVFSRLNPDKILAWSLAGGLFFTSNKGMQWNNAGSDFWNRSGCSSAAFAPDDQNTWYAASNVGGSYGFVHLGTLGGIYRTNNSGATWQLIGPAVGYTPSNYAFNILSVVTKILIDPTNPARGYVATRDGLYRSNNINGSSVIWTQINSGWIEDMEFRTNNSGMLIITKKNSSNTWTVETTSDGGNPTPLWTILPSLTTSGHSHSYSTSQLIIEVSDAAPNDVYVLQRTVTNHNDLYKYNFVSGIVTFKSTNPSQTGGDGFCVSNYNPNIVYLSAGIQFRKSTNGGSNFGSYFSYDTSNFKYHYDVDKIITPPNNCIACTTEVYLGTHGGVSYSNDDCTTMETRSNGLAIANGDFSNSATNPEKIMVGLDHDGTVLSSGTYSSNPSLSWKTVYGGDGMPPLVDYSDPNYAWAAAQNNQPYTYPHFLSSSGGVANSYNATNFIGNNGFSPFIFQNQKYPEIVYVSSKVTSGSFTYEEIFRSSSRGLGTPEKISDFFNINLIANPWPDNIVRNYWIFQGIYPTSNPNTMYVTLSQNAPPYYGKLYRNDIVLDPNSNNVRNSWVELTLPNCPGSNCKINFSYICVDSSNPNIVYLGYNVGYWVAPELYRADYTNPNAPTFINIAGTLNAGGLPMDARNIITEKGSNGGIYVANDVGVFYSNNSMLDFVNPPPNNNSQWLALGSNLTHIPLKGIEINYSINKIRVSTAGRGVWEHDLFCPNNLNFNFSGSQNSSAFHEAVNEITSTAIIAPTVNVTYRAGTYIDLNPGFEASQTGSNDFKAFIHPCSYTGNSPGLRETSDLEYELPDDFEDGEEEFTRLKIFPNPGSGIFTIQLIEENAEVKVFDAMGKEIKSFHQQTLHQVLDLTGYPKGLYLISVTVDEKIILGKVILE